MPRNHIRGTPAQYPANVLRVFAVDPTDNIDTGTYWDQAAAYQLPASVTDTAASGVPQAPWYSGLLDAAGQIATNYANVQIAGDARRQGIAYTGSAPWIAGASAPPQTAAAQNSTLLFIGIVVVALALAAKG